jgi:hypothetical protein
MFALRNSPVAIHCSRHFIFDNQKPSNQSECSAFITEKLLSPFHKIWFHSIRASRFGADANNNNKKIKIIWTKIIKWNKIYSNIFKRYIRWMNHLHWNSPPLILNQNYSLQSVSNIWCRFIWFSIFSFSFSFCLVVLFCFSAAETTASLFIYFPDFCYTFFLQHYNIAIKQL